MKRKEAREQAFILIFEKMFQKDCDMSKVLETFDQFAFEDKDEEHLIVPVDDFARVIALGSEEQEEVLDSLVEKYAIGWKINRIPRVTLSILKMALYEMKYCDDVPVSVTINEAVDIAKKYSTLEDSKFINGVLGSFAREPEVGVLE